MVDLKANVIKRNGEEVAFDITKIVNAITKANNEVDHIHRMNEYQIRAVADNIVGKVRECPHAVSVEEIRAEPGFETIRAVQEGRVYLVDEKLVSRPTPALLEGMKTLRRLLYPEEATQ